MSTQQEGPVSASAPREREWRPLDAAIDGKSATVRSAAPKGCRTGRLRVRKRRAREHALRAIRGGAA